MGATPMGRARASVASEQRLPNILVLVLDALSAFHLSLHGYPRRTSPNIDSFAEESTVFHSHYSAGNFTTSGTASMLTGLLPWSHRAINHGGLVRETYVRNSPFALLASDFFRLSFTQNTWAHRLILQDAEMVDRLLQPASYSLLTDGHPLEERRADSLMRSFALDEFLFPMQGELPAASSMLGYLRRSRTLRRQLPTSSPRYPKGAPEAINPGAWIPYLNEQVFDGVVAEVQATSMLDRPFLAYIHLWSPHFPYRPRSDYRSLFRDEFVPTPKRAPYLPGALSEDWLLNQRTLYDRQIRQLDDEFGEMMAHLRSAGLLRNTYVILTSDHGELFERGFYGHGLRRLYEPVVRIPLIIHEPGQRARREVWSPTSNVDLFPTLLSLVGVMAPPKLDGSILPPFGGDETWDRPVFSADAATNSAASDIKHAALCMRQGALKLIAYLGLPGLDEAYELYDVEEDPGEENDLAQANPALVERLRGQLLDHLSQANRVARSS